MAIHHTRQVPDLASGDSSELERWVRRSKTSQALALRARIVLNSATGRSDTVLQNFPKVFAPKTPDLGRFCLFLHGPCCNDFRKTL